MAIFKFYKQPFIIALHYHNQETPGEPSVSKQRQRDGCRGSYSKNDTEKSIFGTAMERDGEQLMEPWKKREAGEKEKVEGWMEGRGAMKGSCSTCDGWALAQVWRRDQIKSLSRQQWTRDKVITFAPSFPLSPPSLSTTLSPTLSGLSSLELSASCLSVYMESWPSLQSVVRHISIMYSGSLLYAITYFHLLAWWIWLSVRNNILKQYKKTWNIRAAAAQSKYIIGSKICSHPFWNTFFSGLDPIFQLWGSVIIHSMKIFRINVWFLLCAKRHRGTKMDQ